MNINALTASRIREIRKNAGLSSEAVAKDLGLSRSAFSQLENGHVEITLSKIEALAGIFNVPLSDIIPNVNSNHQVSNGSGANFNNSQSFMYNNFFTGKDERLEEVIKALSFSLEELRKQQHRQQS